MIGLLSQPEYVLEYCRYVRLRKTMPITVIIEYRRGFCGSLLFRAAARNTPTVAKKL